MAQDRPFDYGAITSVLDSSGVLQNQGSYTPYNKNIILRLRDDVDTLGELLNETAGGWTNNNFDWDRGDRFNLHTDSAFWLSYITDLRTACEDLSTTAGISAPTWTVSTASLKPLYKRGLTATISGNVLTQTGADFTDVTSSTDYIYVQSGTGANVGRYLISGKTTDTVTMTGYSSGDSGGGDVEYLILLTGNGATFTNALLKSLITDIQTAIMAVVNSSAGVGYWVDAQFGDDANDGSTQALAFETWDAAVQAANSTPLNIYLMGRADGDRAVYTVGSNALTASNITISGSATDLIILDNPVANGYTMSNGNNQDWSAIFFGNGGSQGVHVNTSKSGHDYSRCAFFGGADLAFNGSNVGATFGHCIFISTNPSFVLQQAWNNNMIFNDCAIIGSGSTGVGIRANSGGSATVTLNYCAFYGVTNKWTVTTTVTFNNNNMFSDSVDPEILDNTIAYLSDTSPYIGEAADGSNIGAYPDTPYNRIRSAADTITIAEAPTATSKAVASDTIVLHESLSSADMNISVDLALWGLFRSAADGVVSYYDQDLMDTFGGLMADHVTNWQYDGATLDLSWDNTAGDLFEVHITVDDGSTDYSPVAWWEVNALNPAASTTGTVGSRGYALSCYIDTETGDEWGDGGAFSTVAADGENDQQWDVTLEIRVKNTVTGQWSEVVELSKTYNFNTFADTMYYMADNPRSVDDEYANHANYLAQIYHTGTDKYTRIDGVDWAADNRRYAYNPHVKAKYHIITKTGQVTPVSSNQAYEYWKDRWTGNFQPFGESNAAAIIALYPCVFSNYGDYNTSSAHCFATSTNIINDNGDYQSDSPILGGSAASGSPTDIPYLFLTGYLGTDCISHSSARGFLVWMPSGEILGHLSGVLGTGINPTSEIFFQTGAPNAPTCPAARFYLHILGAGNPYWWFSNGEIKINEDLAPATDLGYLKFNASHEADTPF